MSTPLPLFRTRLRTRYRSSSMMHSLPSSSSPKVVGSWSRRRPRVESLWSSRSLSTTTMTMTRTTMAQHVSLSPNPTGMATSATQRYPQRYQRWNCRTKSHRCYTSTGCLARSAFARNPSDSARLATCTDPRRWASSMGAGEEAGPRSLAEVNANADAEINANAGANLAFVLPESDPEAEDSDSGSETSASDSTAAPKKKKKKKNKRQKRRESMAWEQSLDVRFLHFRDYRHFATAEGNEDENKGEGNPDADANSNPDPQQRAASLLRDDFDRLAFDHDLSRFKWISMLEKRLVLRLREERETDAPEEPKRSGNRMQTQTQNQKRNRLRDYWKVALKAASNPNKVPEDLKAHFLSRMVVQNEDGERERERNTESNHRDVAHSGSAVGAASERADAAMLARGRELAVEHPLLWRRYSAKERKHKVRIAKTILRERAGKGESSGDEALAASRDRSASLDFYLDRIRIPALTRAHFAETTEEQKWEDALAMQKLLRERLPETSYRKMMALVETYVDCFTAAGATDDDDDDPNDGDGDGERLVTLPASPLSAGASASASTDSGTIQTGPEAPKTTKRQQKKQKQFRVLLSNLRKVLPQGRIHWIAKDVADFFYVTAPDEVDLTVARRRVPDDAGVTPNHQTFDSFEMDLVAQDPVLGHSQANWNEVRDQYVQSFLNLQQLFLELEREQQQQEQQQQQQQMVGTAGKAIDDIDQILGEHDDPSSEESVVQTFDIVTALSRLDQKKTTTERVRPREYIPLEAMAMGEYWKQSPQRNGATTGTENSDDAVMADLQESKTKHGQTNNNDSNDSDANDQSNGSSSSAAAARVFDNDSFPLDPPVERLVVVDNLPIDINERRLREAYGRCGAIEAVQIFHSRPDLDPGRRSTDSTKKIRSPSSSTRRQKWSRPRTPLYAMVLYKDARSAGTAACDPLRIFGMVLDHHLMRSHRASDMTTLYLEDVPSSLHSVSSMEFELSRLLRPADLYLCLDDSGHKHLRKKGGGKKSQPLSYTIKFPSFEAAYWSYWKLSLELQMLREETEASSSHSAVSGPALHWMETPKDAQLYWTRKLNF